jgi:hypothetical protein
MLMVLLSACNLGNTGTQGGSQSVISGAPVVRIAAPLPNATYLEGVSVNIQAAVSNAGTDIDRVEIAVDDAIAATLPKPNTAGTPTFSVAQTWTATGAGQHTIAVTAFRTDGSSSAAATVNVTVVSQSAQATPTKSAGGTDNGGTQPTQGSGGSDNSGTNGQQAQPTQGPTATPAPPTDTPPPPATDTPSKPQVTFTQGVNLRRGPDVKFAPPIGSYAAGQTADIVAKTQAGNWYKIQGTNGLGWVSAQFVTVSGDDSAIAIDNGPPIPTDTPAFTATPVATATPQTAANIVMGNVGIVPDLPLKCKRTVEFKIDIANLGTQATAAGGSISIKDYWNGQEQASTTGAFPVIEAGKTINVAGIFLTVNTNVETDHKLVITLNSTGNVPETTTADNSREYTYKLQAC